VTSSNAPDHGTDHTLVAHLVVHGVLEPQLRAVLPECRTATDSGNAHITWRMSNQEHLYAILDRIRNLDATLSSRSVDQ
jgi:hypothetical protein